MKDAIDEVGGTGKARGTQRAAEAALQQWSQQAQDKRSDAAQPQDAYQQQETQLKARQQQAAQQMDPAAMAQAQALQTQARLQEGRNGLVNGLADLLNNAAPLQQQLYRLTGNNLVQQLNNHLGGSFAPEGLAGSDPGAHTGAGGGAGVGQQWAAPTLQLIVPAARAGGGSLGPDTGAGRHPLGGSAPWPDNKGLQRLRRRPSAAGTAATSDASPEATGLPGGDAQAQEWGSALMDALGLSAEQAAGALATLCNAGDPLETERRFHVLRRSLQSPSARALLLAAGDPAQAMRTAAALTGHPGFDVELALEEALRWSRLLVR